MNLLETDHLLFASEYLAGQLEAVVEFQGNEFTKQPIYCRDEPQSHKSYQFQDKF